MAGRSDPPEGTPPEGFPNSGDDDYRSVVFDESFVRAARLQEYSATERAADHAPAVRTLPPPAPAPAARTGRTQVLLLVLLVVLAFATAVYMGVRTPAQPTSDHHPEALHATVVPLAPTGPVPGGKPAELFLHSPAAQFRTGAEGVQLPVPRGTQHFSESQVQAALTIAKDYLVQSSLDPRVLTGREVRAVRLLLDPDQQNQFDAAFETPAKAGAEASGWLVRFDPEKVALAGAARANGTLRAVELGPDLLDVTSDHTFVYPLRPATAKGTARADAASLFTVRRELHFRYDAEDLRRHRAELLTATALAGPQACGAPGAAESWQPLLAGLRAPEPGKPAAGAPAAATGSPTAPASASTAPSADPAGIDPYATGAATGTLCGTLSAAAQPTGPPSR
ncbi:hypothetical protein GCM10010329_39210 [Streptomyces spiroverticillatus]|uniref:Uncharacterized protein n=1 Tax=Streptomyces finlayi TaxID=67296 RepID=A0A918WXV5_9ACTN|nr:hypothetical protein [Streptomyces finlayi]GHA12330.1 hypothetical protein GCM10010329_39210 [Streptomyces spiroverticillatus]GHC94428.1 hypothetical protein GCM10010334_32410 [Streptomyces finlayi]